MIRRHAEEEIELEQVRHDLENGLEDPELTESLYKPGFSDIDFQIEYAENGRYTATSEEYSINVETGEDAVKVETVEKKQEGEFRTREYVFHRQTVELPDRNIGSWNENPIDSSLRSYARELYPEKKRPAGQDSWRMGIPPSERESGDT